MKHPVKELLQRHHFNYLKDRAIVYTGFFTGLGLSTAYNRKLMGIETDNPLAEVAAWGFALGMNFINPLSWGIIAATTTFGISYSSAIRQNRRFPKSQLEKDSETPTKPL